MKINTNPKIKTLVEIVFIISISWSLAINKKQIIKLVRRIIISKILRKNKMRNNL